MLIAAVPLIERLGRRTLLIWVAPVCIASLLAIGGIVRSGSSSTGGALVALASVQDFFLSRSFCTPLYQDLVFPHCVAPLLLADAPSRRCLWQAAFSLGVGPMGYVYVAETSTMRLRAKTTGLAITGIQAMATVYVYIAPIMLNAPGLGMSNTGEKGAGGVPCIPRRRTAPIVADTPQSSSGPARAPSCTSWYGSSSQRQRDGPTLS